ncbi:MAG: alpha/beta hydrolase [Candidatus Nanopelagicales bacterium]
MPTRGLLRWLVTAALVALAVPTIAVPGDTAARGPLAERAPSTSIAWTSCGERLECARIRVPLDWDRPRGRTISLAVIRHLASRPEERIGSLFINPGGPGESGVELVKGAGSELDAWGDGRFDLVSWDPRGTNASTPVRCFRSPRATARFWKGVTIPATKRASEAYSRKVAAMAKRCGRVSGWLLPHVTTADTARDLDHLRSLVGDQKLTYAGLSYGSYLGQTYANMYPDHVRAMMLDGIVNPVRYSRGAEARIANGVSASDEVFDQFLRTCRRAGPAECALAGGKRTPAQRIRALFQRARQDPIPAPGLTPKGALTEGDLLISQFQPMRTPATWPQNAADLRAALRGEASALEAGARPLLTPQGWTGVATSTAIQCADAAARQPLQAWPKVIDRLERVSRMQGPVNGWWLWAPCAAWPVKGQDAYRGPWNASTTTPILLIGTRFDPNTPYQSAVRAQRLLGNAVLLTHDGYGHLSYQDPSACVEAARVAYLVDLVPPAPGTVCEPDQSPFE